MRKRRGEIATILTVATLVVVGVTAVVSSLNLNKKQTTSSRADELCKVQSCGSLSTNGAAKYYAKYISGVWKYFKDVDCKNEAIEGVGTYCKSQNYAEGNECIARDCPSPNETKKYYQWKTSAGGKSTMKLYSDKGICSAEISDKEQYCKTAGGPNVTPAPGQNPPNWGLNQGGGCGSGGANYKFGSCYQGKRCIQCQHGGTWLSYNCFEDDSSCTGDVTYCDAPWKVTTCSNGVHKCCDTATGKCIKSGNKPTDPQEDIANCIKPAEDICNAASGEYCGDAGGSCKTGDTLVSPAKICDSAANKRCCKKSNTCIGNTYECIVRADYDGATDTEKCHSAKHYMASTVSTCGDSSKICCLGDYTPPPVADVCTPLDGECPKSDGGGEYTYYKSDGVACATPGTASKCYGISGSDCKKYTLAEVKKIYCSGEAPADIPAEEPVCAGSAFNCNSPSGICDSAGGSTTKSYYVTSTTPTFGVNESGTRKAKSEADLKKWCECKTATPTTCSGAPIKCSDVSGICTGFGGDATKSYFKTITSASPPVVYGVNGTDKCENKTETELRAWCKCTNVATIQDDSCPQDVTGCRIIDAQHQSCSTSTHVYVNCKSGTRYCCEKPPVVEIPTKIYVSIKNNCKYAPFTITKFCPAFSGYFYDIQQRIAVGETTSPVDISSHCKDWAVVNVQGNFDYWVGGIDCTKDGKQKNYLWLIEGDWCGGA